MARFENLNVRKLRVREILMNQMDGTGDSSLSGTEVTLLDGATSANSTVSKAAVLDSGGDLQTASNVGTANTGVTAQEYGDGWRHMTRLAVSQADALTVADNAALADGYLLYTFPAGEIVINSVSVQMAITLAEDTTATPDVGLGTVIASGAVATLDGTATFENIMTGAAQTDCNGTVDTRTLTAGSADGFVIADGDAHTLHFNVADTWADTAGADLTGDIAGIVVIDWSYMGNPA